MDVVQVFSPKSTNCMTSRVQLLSWLNGLLATEFTNINELCTGAAYLQLMDMLFPYRVPMHRVRMYTNAETDCIRNFKLLELLFEEFGVEKNIPVAKLVKGSLKDNLEFLQWFKQFFDANKKNGQYNALEKRGGLEMGYGPPKCGILPIFSMESGVKFSEESSDVVEHLPLEQRTSGGLQNRSLASDCSRRMETPQEELERTKNRLRIAECQRDEYLKCLKEIEMLCHIRDKSVSSRRIEKLINLQLNKRSQVVGVARTLKRSYTQNIW